MSTWYCVMSLKGSFKLQLAPAADPGRAWTPYHPGTSNSRPKRADVKGRLELAADPQVRGLTRVMGTRLIKPVGSGPSDVHDAVAWGLQATGAIASPYTGEGVTVAVLDTGIDSEHPAFAGVDLVPHDFTGLGMVDTVGHGTHCAGTIFGRDVHGTRIGVAPGIRRALIGRILDDEGVGSSAWIFNALHWAMTERAQVISMSIGLDFPGSVASEVEDGWPPELATSRALEAYRGNLRMFDSLMSVIKADEAFGQGAVVVAASGNESRRDLHPNYRISASLPAASEGVLSVAALEQTPEGLAPAPFSNSFGSLAAPGVDIVRHNGVVGLLPKTARQWPARTWPSRCLMVATVAETEYARYGPGRCNQTSSDRHKARFDAGR